MIYKLRIKEKRILISMISLLLLLYVTWFFESEFAEVMFFMDYDAEDLAPNAKSILLDSILTWERYIDSSMRYIINFFPMFSVFPALHFLQERKSYFVLGAHRFNNYKKSIVNSIIMYSLIGGFVISISFTVFFLLGNLFLKASITNIGGFAMIFPDGFYAQNPCLFFLFMAWTIYFLIGFVLALLTCGLALFLDKEIYISIATFVIYIGLSFLGQMFDFLPFKISESVCAFNTLYSTVEIFVPAISILIFDIVLVGVGVFKRGKFVDA